MILGYKKFDLFGKSFLQKLELQSPFDYSFPVAAQACFLYMLAGEMEYQQEHDQLHIPANHALLLNCNHAGQQIHETTAKGKGEVVIVTFHPDVLKKIYEKELPLLFQPGNKPASQIRERISNDFLIQKYIEGLLFYFENPSLVNDEILVLKLKEIILLLSQTRNAESIQVIVSQLFSSTVYTFKQVIEANLFSPIGVEELALKTNLSISSFKREFKKLYDHAPAGYIKNKRLEKAAELLTVSDKRITEIAFDCGFNDLSTFSKSFYDKYKTTPTNFRARVHK